MAGQYDVFISYAHAADAGLSPQLQRGLQSLARPWHRRSALRVFRDETGLSANPGLWTSISTAMEESGWLVLLASPEAARSVWVNREVEQWLMSHEPGRIIAVVTGGTWAWDPVSNTFAPESDAVPPALASAFTEEPRHVDMRWAAAEDPDVLDLRHPRFRDQLAEIAAPVHGVSKDDLTGEDVRQYRRTRRLAWSAVTSLVALLLLASVAAVVAYAQSGMARRSESLAVAARLTAEQAQQRALDAADTARSLQTQAEASAALALKRKSEAEASAALALRRKNEADASTAEAQRQRRNADAQRGQAARSAQEALARRAEAERQTRLAEDAAARADAAAAEAEGQRSRATASAALALRRADEARRAQQEAERLAARLTVQALQLEADKASLEQQKAQILQNEAMITASNVELTARGLLSAAQARQAEGRHDTGLLLHAQALAADAQRAQARVSTARELAQVRTARYLPGPESGGALVAGPGHVATGGDASGDQPALVWDVARPEQAPVVLSGARTGVTATTSPTATPAEEPSPPGPPGPGDPAGPPGPGDPAGPPGPGPQPPIPPFARQTALHGFDATGTRLLGVTADLTIVRVWDSRTGVALLSLPTKSQGFAPVDVQVSPDRRTALVQTDTEAAGARPTVVAVDLATARVVRTWPGTLRTSLGYTGAYQRARDATPFAPDGHHFLYLDRDGPSATWVVADSRSDARTPFYGASLRSAPRFSADGTEVIGVVESGYLLLRLRVTDGFPVGVVFLTEQGVPAPVLAVDRDDPTGTFGALLEDGRVALFGSTGRLDWASSDPVCGDHAGRVSFDAARFNLVVLCTSLGSPSTLVVVPLTAPNNMRDWPLNGVPVSDILVEAPETWAVLAQTGTLVHFPYHGAIAEYAEPRLGVQGPCVMRQDPQDLLCGATRVPLTRLSDGADPEVVVPDVIASRTAVGTGGTWYAVAAGGRVMEVDPQRARPAATVPAVATGDGYAVTSDARWMVSTEGGTTLITDLRGGTRVRAAVPRPGELVAGLSVLGRDPAVLVGQLDGVGQSGSGFASVLDARTGRPWDLDLAPFTVAAANGTALASLSDGTLTVRSGTGLSTARRLSAPDAVVGPATSPMSRSWLAVGDGGSVVAYVATVPGPPPSGGTAHLVVRDVASGSTLLTAALRDDEIAAAYPPQLLFTPDGGGLVMRTPERLVRWATNAWTRTGEVSASGCDQASAPVADRSGVFIVAGGRLHAGADLAVVDGSIGCHGATAFRGGDDLVLFDAPTGRLTGRTVPTTPSSLSQAACAVAGRNIGKLEWLQYLPAAPQRATCAQWPYG